jgi:hypothetical protein
MGAQDSQEDMQLWWQEELMRRLRDFLAAPEGAAEQALRETMTRYREAVASRSVTPPLFPRVQP